LQQLAAMESGMCGDLEIWAATASWAGAIAVATARGL
jgi:hypothetical protein